MTSSRSNRTPVANDPVESLVEEFLEAKRNELQEDAARPAPTKQNPPNRAPIANPIRSTVGEAKLKEPQEGKSRPAPKNQNLPNRTPIADERVESLVGEFIEAKRKEIQEERAARPVPKTRNPMLIALLAVLCATIWIVPSFLPPREPAVSQETLESGAKLTIYLASLRVRDYVDTHKRLPTNLTEAGVDSTGITYLRNTPKVFELSTRVQGTRLLYRSTMPDSVFLGGNLRVRGIS